MDTTSSWSAIDQYDPQLHGQPEQLLQPSARGMAIAVAFAGAVILVALAFIAQAIL